MPDLAGSDTCTSSALPQRSSSEIAMSGTGKPVKIVLIRQLINVLEINFVFFAASPKQSEHAVNPGFSYTSATGATGTSACPWGLQIEVSVNISLAVSPRIRYRYCVIEPHKIVMIR